MLSDKDMFCSQHINQVRCHIKLSTFFDLDNGFTIRYIYCLHYRLVLKNLVISYIVVLLEYFLYIVIYNKVA